MKENLKLWNLVEKTNPKDTKEFKGKGGFKGTAICAQSQKKKATEVFGLFGSDEGWRLWDEKFEILKISDDFHDNLLVYSAVLLYDFEGIKGRICLFSEIKIWNYSNSYKTWSTNNDVHKKVKTDAVTKGLSELGFNSDVFLGMYDDNKYIQQMNEEFNKKPEKQVKLTQKQKELKEFSASQDFKENKLKALIKKRYNKELYELTDKEVKGILDKWGKQ